MGKIEALLSRGTAQAPSVTVEMVKAAKDMRGDNGLASLVRKVHDEFGSYTDAEQADIIKAFETAYQDYTNNPEKKTTNQNKAAKRAERIEDLNLAINGLRIFKAAKGMDAARAAAQQ